MSLNGLDASAVHEAHQIVLAEAGGWFLLKYVNRDTVEVLSRGTAGVTEAKIAVEQYEEKSPLYGLIQYRRKRVVLKYVPEGTSRLLQVRLTVQFQSILDAFPHDTVFSFATPFELVDSALGLSTMLQPPAHSGALTPSNSSGRHHRLNEIREDGEETISASQFELITIPVAKPREEIVSRPLGRSDLDSLPASAVKAKALLAKRKEADAAAAAEAAAARARAEEEMTVTTFDEAPSISGSKVETIIHPLREDSLNARALTAPKAWPEKAHATTITFPTPPSTRHGLYRLREEAVAPPLPTNPELPRSPERPSSRAHHTRHLSEHESDSISQWNKQVAAFAESSLPLPKSKKKLAPRPHLESSARPKTPTNVAILPASVRASNRSNVNLLNRPDSRHSSKSVPTRFVPAQIVPAMPTTPLPQFYRSPDSRRAPSVVSSAFTENPSAPPEKLRLMRALQLRKRNVLLAQRAASVQSSRTQDTYVEEFHARNRSEPLNEPRQVPSTPITTNSQVARVSAEHKRDLSSTTASPTSVTTASMDRSTMPSSVSGDLDEKSSSKSFSMDTHSSSTPRAVLHRGVPLKVQLGYSAGDNPDSDDENQAKESTTPNVSPLEEAFMRLTGASTPPVPETVVEQPTPKADDVAVNQRPNEPEPSQGGLKPSNTGMRKDSKSGVSHGSRDRRRGEYGSMQTSTSAEISDDVSDDDSFIEELRNATVQQAKPISVPRVSITPKMRKLSVDKLRDIVRIPASDTHKKAMSVSNEPEKKLTASARSASAGLPNWPPVAGDGSLTAPLSHKPTLGSGISKRIKALEVLTYRESIQSSPPSPREAPASRSTFTGLMSRASILSPFQTPNASIDKSPPKKLPETRSMPPPKGSTVQVPQPLVQRQGEATEIFVPQRKGETVSVTARIVRNQPRPPTSFPPQFNESAVNLHRSPLIVEHDRRDSDVSRPSMPRDMSNGSSEPINSSKSDKRRFSFSSHKSGSTARQGQADGRTSRISITGRERRHGKTNSETSSITEDKRPSRAGRFMKRVSGLGTRFGQSTSSNKDGPQPETIMELSEGAFRRESTSESSSVLQMIDLGDVNVQFPETLLWKRRYMRIDDQGYLVFSPPSDNVHIRMTNRKFHLGDLRAPTVPDREREEMAWSICIDLEDGHCIQCACESKQAQRQILKMLRDAHDAYNSLYS